MIFLSASVYFNVLQCFKIFFERSRQIVGFESTEYNFRNENFNQLDIFSHN